MSSEFKEYHLPFSSLLIEPERAHSSCKIWRSYKGFFFNFPWQVQCRDRIEEDSEELIHIKSYGELGAQAFGTTGRYLTELLVLVSQAGGAIAYLVFIGQNLSSIFLTTGINHHWISPPIFIFLLLLPLEIALCFIRSLSSLAPFSAFADVCNVLAMAIVIKEDFQLFKRFSRSRRAFNGAFGLPFAAGVAVFCFEGFSMTLALESSMAERGKFRRVLSLAFLGITLAYICFGIFGYLAYGDETKDIITLNLPNNWSAITVKVNLSHYLKFVIWFDLSETCWTGICGHYRCTCRMATFLDNCSDKEVFIGNFDSFV